MNILIVRHAQAEEFSDWNLSGKSDGLRPLTKKGIVRFSKAVKNLAKLIESIDCIYTSQLTRAIQTAEMLHGLYGSSSFETIEELNPEAKLDDLIQILDEHEIGENIAFVGHQPSLSSFTSLLLSKTENIDFRFKKGGAALLTKEGGSFHLEWFLTQKQLMGLSLND